MGVKSFDFNNDGRMDVYVTDMHSDMHPFIASDMGGKEKDKSDEFWVLQKWKKKNIPSNSGRLPTVTAFLWWTPSYSGRLPIKTAFL